MTSEARVETPNAKKYLVQLCKHFSHKIPATFADDRGRIEFEMGPLDLDATQDGVLTLRASSDAPEGVARLRNVAARHLERFAFRETLTIAWADV